MSTVYVEKNSRGEAISISTTYGRKEAPTERNVSLAEAVSMDPFTYGNPETVFFSGDIVAAYNDFVSSR